jgi:lipid-binding SYLF domain-containing protein
LTKLIFLLIVLVALAGPAAADWQPDPTDELQVRARAAADRFLAERVELQRFFDGAAGYAVYPSLTRGGFMFGAAYGKGVVVPGERLAGYTSQWRFSVGAQLGVQNQAQIIFFRDAETLAAFKRGTLEFNGQTSASVATLGGALDPGYNPRVTIFSLTRAGLMLEASAAAVKYRFRAAD